MRLSSWYWYHLVKVSVDPQVVPCGSTDFFDNTNEYSKVHISELGRWHEDMIDHCSYAHNLSSCEMKASKKIQAWTELEPMTSATDRCTVLYKLSYQTSWVLATLWPLCAFVIIVITVGLIAQVVDQWFHNCSSCVHYCDDQSYLLWQCYGELCPQYSSLYSYFKWQWTKLKS